MKSLFAPDSKPASPAASVAETLTTGQEQSLYNMLQQAPVAMVVFNGPDHIIELANDLYLPIAGKTRVELLNKPVFEAIPIAASQGFRELLDEIRRTGEPLKLHEHKTLIERGGRTDTTYLNIVYQPLKEPDGSTGKIMILVSDVTEQVEARRKTKESEQRFGAAIRAVEGILWTNNAIGEMNGEQPGWAGLTGQSYEEYQGFGWARAVHPEDAGPTVEAWNEAVRERKPFIFEHRVRMKGGVWGLFSIRAIPLFNSDGTIREWVGVHTDITAQRLTETSLKESEQRFRTFADSITNLAWMADGEGWIYWYNQRWYDYTGSTLEEMQGWGWNKVHHPDHMDRVVAYVQNARKGDEPYEMTFPLKGKDGAFRWFLTRVVPVKDGAGKVIRWIGTNTDIHQQYLAEERFRTLAETLPLLVWMTDEKGVQEYASRQWMEYTGLDPMEPDSWQQTVHSQDMEGITKTWSVSLATGEPYKAEVRLKSKAGEYRWHYVHGEPIKDEKGSISKWVGAFTDIDDQKENTQKLEALVQQRTRELHRSNEDLQQFAHVASHDLKEPVRKIRTFSGRLQQDLGKELPESGKTYLRKIEAAAARMTQMIDGVLTYSTLSASDKEQEPVNINEVLGHIESDLEIVIGQKKATLQYKDLPVVEGAPVLLYQLFYNLINNALKFSRADLSPLITITAKIVEAGEAGETGLIPAYSYCQIVVKDNGIGFSPDYADKIFHTFTRLHAKDQYEGTGLGLALCKKIVERHGGTITATGVEGEGATFCILLPLKQTP